MPFAPVICILMLGFAFSKLHSKFDIPNGARGLRYLYTILT